MEYLFSYGTLQKEKVQLESFGRILKGAADSLLGYKLSAIEIKDEDVLAKSQQQYHPIAVVSADQTDRIEGLVFEISPEELKLADSYEVDDYKRVKVILASGQEAWVYVAAL